MTCPACTPFAELASQTGARGEVELAAERDHVHLAVVHAAHPQHGGISSSDRRPQIGCHGGKAGSG
jgi:hypothetical protein